MRPPQATITVTLSVDPIGCTYADPNEPMRFALAGEMTARLNEAVARRHLATDPFAKALRRRIAKNVKDIAWLERKALRELTQAVRRHAAHEAMKARKGKARCPDHPLPPKSSKP